MCLASTVVASWSLTKEVTGSNNFFKYSQSNVRGYINMSVSHREGQIVIEYPRIPGVLMLIEIHDGV